jgi:hypothetical protein
VLFEEWASKPQPLDRQDALAEIARRYLAAYAPAGPQDLASWSGLKLGEARQAWRSIESEIVPVDSAGQAAWMLVAQLEAQLAWLDEPFDETLAVRLLPRHDAFGR